VNNFSINKVNRIILTIVVVFISFLFSFIFMFTDFYKNIQNTYYDNLFRNIKSENTKTKNVEIIAIDDNSLIEFEKSQNYWPLPRSFYAIISDYLIAEGAKAVVFDIIFSSPDLDRLNSIGSENDEMFYNVITKTKKIILPFTIDNKYKKDDKLSALKIYKASNFDNVSEYKYLSAPYSAFTIDNKNFGFVDIKGQSDGIIREYKPFVKIKDEFYPSLALATILSTNKEISENLKLNKDGNFNLNWYGYGGIESGKSAFKYISFVNISKDARSYFKERNKYIPKGLFKNKVLFIGSSARGLLDQKMTPFTVGNNAYPGVEIHATAYLNLLNEEWLKTINPFEEFLIYLILCLVLVFVGINNKSLRKYSLFFLVIVIFALIIQVFMFVSFHITVEMVFLLTISLVSYILTLILNYITVGHDRNLIKNALSSYYSPELVRRIVDSDKPLSTGGETVNATVMFIDIEGFTTFSEKNPPEKVVDVLNIYLKTFSEIIISNKGFVNKFLGDGLLALFGTPSKFEDHPDMAVNSSIECLKTVDSLSKKYGLKIRIGLNTGDIISGNMGGMKKLEFTAIGDNVNLASRLEGANKFFATSIILSESTYKRLNNKKNINYLGNFSVKGKDLPIGVYFYDNYSKPEIIENFNKLVKYYELCDIINFNKISEYFLLTENSFGPANFYINYYNNNKDLFGKFIKLTDK